MNVYISIHIIQNSFWLYIELCIGLVELDRVGSGSGIQLHSDGFKTSGNKIYNLGGNFFEVSKCEAYFAFWAKSLRSDVYVVPVLTSTQKKVCFKDALFIFFFLVWIDFPSESNSYIQEYGLPFSPPKQMIFELYFFRQLYDKLSTKTLRKELWALHVREPVDRILLQV